jgi:tetratricopeptide (TPR) repeat protein
MSGQVVRWAMAFVATLSLSLSLVVSAARVPAPAALADVIVGRDPSSVTDVELELLLNKIREGDLLSQTKDAAGARRAWREARRMGAGLWPIHEGLGDSYARARLFDEALAEYALAASLVPDKLAPMRGALGAKRAAALGAARQSLGAIQAYLELNQSAIYGGRILDLAMSSDTAAAVQRIERHAEVYDARLFRLVAALYSKLGREPEAAQALAKFAVHTAPWDESLTRPAIELLRKRQQFEPALEVCRAWVRATPESVDGYQFMGDILWDADRRRESLVAYSSIVAIRPGDSGSYRKLGEIYLKRNLPDEAMAQFEAGLKLAPNDQEMRGRIVPALIAKVDRLKAEGKRDEARAVRKRLGELSVEEAGLFDIKIVITWDAMSDVDLDVIEPDGTKINHANRNSKIGGKYFADNTKGLGPETYTLLKSAPGKWRVGAHLHSGARSTVKFLVILFEDTPKEERREETIILESIGETTTFIRDIVIP